MKFPNPNERSGPLVGHVRKGRVYKSPLAATGMLHTGDWVRDDLPDLLWPVLVLSDLGTSAGVRFVRWQKAVQDDLAGKAEVTLVAECLDGRLTSLDRLVAWVPDAVTAVTARAKEHGLLAKAVTSALDSYANRPAAWLTGYDAAAPGQDQISFLGGAVFEVLTDGHREAVIKCLPVWAEVQAGTFASDNATLELLKPYPNDPRTRSRADSAVRAIWGARRGLMLEQDGNRFADAVSWAKTFWNTNSAYTQCLRQGEMDEGGRDEKADGEQPEVTTPDDAAITPEGTPEDGANLRRFAMDLLASYLEALETSPSDLYGHERQEVVSGLVARAGRDVIVALGAPDLWCLEHGAHIARMLVETRVYIQWMARQDPAIYRAFQDYGAGKAKLYARILDELPPAARRPDFEDSIAEFQKLSRNSKILDQRAVDTRDTFADGKSVRAMAEECGLIDLYRQVYYMTSGVTHSEWWSIETHAMERCLNVLHAGHLIPSFALNTGGHVEFATTWVNHLYALMQVSFRILGTDEKAAESAFAWTKDTPAGEPLGGLEEAPADTAN